MITTVEKWHWHWRWCGRGSYKRALIHSSADQLLNVTCTFFYFSIFWNGYSLDFCLFQHHYPDKWNAAHWPVHTVIHTHTHTHSAGLMWLIWVNRAPDDVCALVSQWCVEQPQTDQSDERRPSRNQEGRRGGMSGKKLCNTSPSDVHALAFKQRFHTFKICMSLIQWSNVTQRHVPESGV